MTDAAKKGRRYARPDMSKVLTAFRMIIESGRAADYAQQTADRNLRLIASRELIEFTLEYIDALEPPVLKKGGAGDNLATTMGSTGAKASMRSQCNPPLDCPDDDLFG